ncbi:MAG TPA: hypothetical protein VKA13_06680 [Gammaproteobacteria bacterium]|nr:hypothetical protein [Gammaproteobacteria bacterium]
MEQKMGSLAIVVALTFGLTLVFTMKSILSKPVIYVNYPYNQCIKVATPDGDKPCSWLKSGQPYRMEYITNPQHDIAN